MPLSELGAFLQRQRAESGLALDEIEARTHIRRKYLEAIEAGDWESLPPGVYTRGLLKNYARAVGVSQNTVLRMYVKERASESKLPEPRLISRPLVETPRISTEMVLGLALLAVAVGLFTWTVYTRLIPSLANGAVGMPTVGALAAPTGARATGTAPARRTPGGAAAATPTVDGLALAPLPVDTPEGGEAGEVDPGATGEADPPDPSGTPGAGRASGAPAAPLVMEVLATSDAWLSVRVDQEPRFEGFLRAGDRRSWEANERVRLRTGNAGATEVTLNGRRLEPLGTRGQVVEQEWRLLASGDIEQSG